MHSAQANASLLSSGEQAELLDLGVIRPGAGARCFTLNGLAPAGRTGSYLLVMMVALGVGAWAAVFPYHSAILSDALPKVFPSWIFWAALPLVAVGGTVIHEWGHVLALRVIGGRAGRVRFRLGWPWAVTEVGPFEAVLTPLQCILLVTGGVLVELVTVGLGMAVLMIDPSNPVAGAVVIITGVYLMFNMVPTPWSDGGRALGIAIGQIRALLGRR